MPLTPGQVVGCDAGRMIFNFTMMNEARIIDCEVSSAALADLFGKKGVSRERENQFERLEDDRGPSSRQYL
jgi:hypothetical protein